MVKTSGDIHTFDFLKADFVSEAQLFLSARSTSNLFLMAAMSPDSWLIAFYKTNKNEENACSK